MKKTYTIYHIPGKKVGCTVNYIARKSQYPIEVQETMTILEVREFDTDKEAGDLEWEYADKFGYPRGKHYAESNWNITMTPEDRVITGMLAGKRAKLLGLGFHAMMPEQRTAARKRGGIRAAELGKTPFQNPDRKAASAGGARTAELGLSGFQTGAAIKASIASPNHISKQTLKCPHCGKEGKGQVMFRHHFDRCKNV